MDSWIVVNLIAPIAAPVIGALLVALFMYKRGSKNRKGHPLAPFKDGQLSWSALGMCLSSFYELINPAQGRTVPSGFPVTMGIILVFLLITSVGMAVLGAALPAAWPKPAPSPLSRGQALIKWIFDYSIFLASVIVTAATVYVYWEVHLTTQG